MDADMMGTLRFAHPTAYARNPFQQAKKSYPPVVSVHFHTVAAIFFSLFT
ncbi:MAG: hypothetical protein JZU65_08995 [Chlorobium sp.]|nr:hypothetical protein [Chlorobium sp.]